RSRRSMIFNVASSPAAGQAALFPVLGVIAARQRKIRLPAKAKACDVGADAAYVYRHLTGAVCTTSSPAFSLASLAVKFIRHTAFSTSSEPPPLPSVDCWAHQVQRCRGLWGPWL